MHLSQSAASRLISRMERDGFLERAIAKPTAAASSSSSPARAASVVWRPDPRTAPCSPEHFERQADRWPGASVMRQT
ncbi:MarR family transcriptional regulator [Streptomyces sp. NPDC058964]|uniref:MarR family transcriptional regulator n=1 Tax=Streptomyces sp. NPDC058964 TaxID=3346681 RepID=UPI0036B5BCB3